MNQIILNNSPELPFRIKESLNQLRINLGFCGDDVKVIMMTSSTPNEGKSFISIQLWKMMAGLGLKTLLIDSDLRNSCLRTDYELSCDEGQMKDISHFLAGKAGIQEVIHSTNIENGYIIPVAQNLANPTLLLEKKRFEQMIDACRETFDYVIVDTPPLATVADALKIATHCDGSVLVVRAGDTPKKIVQNSVNLLKPTGKPLLGMILNRVEMDRKGSRYYGHYGRYGRYGRSYARAEQKALKNDSAAASEPAAPEAAAIEQLIEENQ